ncbi:MAG: CoA-binding protein [Planctomycetota bacterium]|jgi:acetyltransferase
MSLEKFFNPKSVAIVGASQTKGKVGYEILTNMVSGGYPGTIFPVNHKADTIENLKCYPTLESIGQVPDLVIVIIPAKFVPGIITECAKIGVKSVIIITAGFKEIGEEGLKLEQQIAQTAKQAGIRIIGPNCLGIISPTTHLNASFAGDLPKKGNIGYLSQSGALLAAAWATKPI